MLLDEVAAFIVADGHATLGTNLFLGSMPAKPDVALSLHEYPGGPPDFVFGTAGVAHEYPRVQVKARGAAADYAGPRRWLEAVYQDLAERVQSATSTGTRYLDLSPVQPPFPLERDESNRWVFAVNFVAMKEVSTSTST